MKPKRDKTLGELINQFENESDQTIEKFNKLFPFCKINGFDPKCKVEIGDYEKGYRKITIDGKDSFDHQFSMIDFSDGRQITNPFTLYHPNKDFIGRFNNVLEACRKLSIEPQTFHTKIENGYYVMEVYGNH